MSVHADGVERLNQSEKDIISGRVTGLAPGLMEYIMSGLRPSLNKIFHQSSMPLVLFAVQISLKLWIAKPGLMRSNSPDHSVV